ncbi:chitinase-3-like protein 2 [Dermacentor variabilis]|uniref:chitinase-3-like protein 2 n=1 Tax=Dermacentor variabilis TaxID=34621 RepID=UPI003F5BAAF8
MADATVTYRQSRFEGLIPLFLASEEPPRNAPNSIFRSRNLCLLVFFVIAIMTAACACAAVVAATAEYFKSTPLDTARSGEEEDVAIPKRSARVAYQLLSQDTPRKRVFCFVNTSLPSGSPRAFDVDNVSLTLCDALVYVAVGLDPEESSIRFKNPVEDEEAIQKLSKVKAPEQTSIIETYACVGGEDSDSADFKRVIRTKKSRLTFIRKAAQWVRQRGLSGLVLYWKYPTETSKTNLSTLLNTMRIYFDKDKIRMAVVVPWNVVTRRHAYFVRSLFDRLDVVIVDTHRTVESSSFPVTTCQSPVRAVFRARYHGQAGLSSVVEALAAATTEHDVLFKVVFSVSLAGVSFTLKHPHLKNGRIGIKAVGPGRPFGHTNLTGIASYYDIVETLLVNRSWTRFLHGYSRCVVAHTHDQWIGFEDRVSLRAKKSILRRTHGMAVWDLSMDDFAGDFGSTWPLLREIHDLVQSQNPYTVVTDTVPLGP